MSENSFRAHGVSPEVDQALAARNITSPFRIQALVLADALAGTDVLAKSPTGSGKTLAFALPIVERIDGRAPRRRPSSSCRRASSPCRSPTRLRSSRRRRS